MPLKLDTNPKGSRRRRGRGLIRPIGAACAVALLGWSGAAAWAAFNAAPNAAEESRIAAVSAAYEARIAALRRELDRISSRELVEQDSLDRRIAQLAARQAQIELRQSALSGIAGARIGMEPVAAAITGSVAAPASSHHTSQKPAPAFDDLPLRGVSRPERRSSLATGVPVAAAGGLVRKVDEVDRALRASEMTQLKQIERVSLDARLGEARLRGVFTRLGLAVPSPALLAADAGTEAVGGPLVTLTGESPMDRMLDEARTAVMTTDRLKSKVAALPLQRPLSTGLEVTSEFGYRRDPFTRGGALHTGLDLRGETGMPALAAAAGTVVTAEWSGGYGNMVEIDHGNGIATRYGHLSGIAVTMGETVVAGETIGRVGSTGRSTGAHLHYEVRINGEPVDPQRFLDSRVAELARGLL